MGDLPSIPQPSAKCAEILKKLKAFMDEHIYPNEELFEKQLNSFPTRWQNPPILEELKAKAKAAGLWNLFLPHSSRGAGLSNVDYGHCCEIMGRSLIAPEVFNCNAPDTGNMEVLERYGSAEHKEKWLKPLLNGEIRSAFLMTEYGVASSDATNISTEIVREGNEYVINGTKWWSSGAGDPRCKIYILMGKNVQPHGKKVDSHSAQSMILVPADAPGVTVTRALNVFGYDDAPHGHMQIELKNVRVPLSNILVGEGKGFEIAQGRLGPGRIHHCMRLIGAAERCQELACARGLTRTVFGKKMAEKDLFLNDIALSRMELNAARLLVLDAAHKMDTIGNKNARREIAAIKVFVPNVALRVIDRALQIHGGAGVSQDFILARFWANSRTLRLADGPDAVHSLQLGRLEMSQFVKSHKSKL